MILPKPQVFELNESALIAQPAGVKSLIIVCVDSVPLSDFCDEQSGLPEQALSAGKVSACAPKVNQNSNGVK